MKIKVKETTEKEVEVKLPYFSKHNTLPNYYKVFGEGNWEAIRIENGDTQYSLSISQSTSSIAFNDSYSECTEQEYLTAFNEAIEKLKLLNSEVHQP